MLKEPRDKKRFFNLSEEDQIDFTLEEKEKAEKEKLAKKVFQDVAKKYNGNKK
ncbi:hypothetical protein [Gracilibacillus oryzae]|uniref:hypothetical protein n=1 Tax=Gracilibacillus oryzae TaxID=1672701 RepID=UPI0012960E80|nr:hypothetical protein [Gracilibacillus oryzae]